MQRQSLPKSIFVLKDALIVPNSGSFFLVVFIVNTVLGIVDSVIGIKIFSSLFSLAVLAPMLGCGARRLHDINKSGWLQLLGLIPVLGVVILIIFWAKPGDNTAK